MTKTDFTLHREKLLALRARLQGDMTQMEDNALNGDHSKTTSMPTSMAELGSDNFNQEFTLSLLGNEKVALDQRFEFRGQHTQLLTGANGFARFTAWLDWRVLLLPGCRIILPSVETVGSRRSSVTMITRELEKMLGRVLRRQKPGPKRESKR